MSWTKHSRQVKGQMLLKTRTLQNPAAWHQTSPPLTHTHTAKVYHTHSHTLAPELKCHCFIHHQPSSPLSFRPPHPNPSLSPTLASHFVSFQMEPPSIWKETKGGAQPRSCHGALILRHLLFFFIFLGVFFLSLLFFEDVLCSFLFPVLFFWREILLLITSISL